MGDTNIAWATKVWNPVTGCSKVSEGCRYCYAEAISHRFKMTDQPWTAEHAQTNIKLHSDRLSEPSRWRKPQRVFVDSMSDLFHERVPDDFISKVFEVMLWNPKHTYIVLTKRAERMRQWISDHFYVPLPHIWLGVSVENQRTADERVPKLIRTPAVVRVLSMEPLLGRVQLHDDWFEMDDPDEVSGAYPCLRPGIRWVIVGGESGPHYRTMDLAWAKEIQDQCRRNRCAFWFKQESGPRPGTHPYLNGKEYHETPAP